MKIKIVLGIVAVAFAAVTASARVDKLINLPFTIAATAEVQGAGSLSGTITNVAAPTKVSITTKSLLATLALDEYYEGNYGSSNFPAGAQIVFVDDLSFFPGSSFKVVDSQGLLLVDVSDLLEFTMPDDAVVNSGQQDTTTGLITKYTESYVGQITFDDRGSGRPGAKYKIYLAGVVNATGTDSTPKNGSYMEKWNLKMSSGGGSGTIGGTNAIISGNAAASGSAPFTLF